MSDTLSTPPAEADETEIGPPNPEGRITAPRVFWPASLFIVVFVAIALIWPTQLGDALSNINTTLISEVGWYYIVLVSAFVFISLWFAFSSMGEIILGDDDEDPEFGLMAWFSMLFAAGMGIGLVFWGVAEPLNHFSSPPPGTGDGASERATEAMNITFLHWGLHAWSIYVIVGLAIAYAVHRKKRPVSIRWALEPLLGDRVNSWIGDLIDVIAVIGTLFGVASSLGFGVSQVAAGMSFLGWVQEASNVLLVILIAAITGLAVISVATGIDKGIKILSNVNMAMAGGLLLFVLILGPTVFLLSDFVQQIGSYIQAFFRLSFQTLAFEEGGKEWVSGWTTFYWGWWISWAPFVGVFIARISRGRTVREFVIGVLLVPTTVTFLWFSIMGGSAIYREMFGNGGLIDEEAGVSTNEALFQLLDGLPLSLLLSVLAMFLIVVFFVTSSDSGSYVVDMLASGGDPNPPVWSRVMWAVLEGAVAAALLLAGGGGLGALQTMAILVAFPFSVVMVFMILATARVLRHEARRNARAERSLLTDEIAGDIARRHDLDRLKR